MSLSRFVALWTHANDPPDPVTEDELRSAEARLQMRLPADYRSAVLQFGLPRPSIDLLNAVVDRNLELKDVSGFLDPVQLVSTTEGWRDLGLPESLAAFANDCMGNLFCFPIATNNDGATPVFFFDHDDRTVDVIAPSFTQWIDSFCSVTAH